MYRATRTRTGMFLVPNQAGYQLPHGPSEEVFDHAVARRAVAVPAFAPLGMCFGVASAFPLAFGERRRMHLVGFEPTRSRFSADCVCQSCATGAWCPVKELHPHLP